MPQIIPIKDLKNTSEISEMCHRATEPIYVTKNGYGDLVVMSIKTYELLTKTSDINDTVSSHKNKIDNEEALFNDKDA